MHCNLLSPWTQVVAGDRQSGQSSLTSDSHEQTGSSEEKERTSIL